MYDKVKLWTIRTRATPDVSRFLDKAKEQIDHETGEVCTFGSLDGLKVSVYVGGISVVGSLAKFLYPNNIYPLDRHTTAQAVEKLSDSIHVQMNNAKVTELEFGRVFVMSQPVESYLSKLGNMPKLQRYHFDVGTLYYKTRDRRQSKVFAFYDKQADAKVKGMALPSGFEDANLLKYEMRLNGRLPQLLSVPEVTASTLSETSFYRLLMKRYQESYFSIHKSSKYIMGDMGRIKTVSDAFDMFVAQLISQSGQDSVTGFLEALREARVFNDRKNYTRLKKKIQEIAGKAGANVPDELIKELDDEVNNVGAYI